MRNSEIVEALIFSAEGALSIKDILNILPDASKQEIEDIVTELNRTYDRSGRSFMIEKVSNGYMFATKKEYSPYLRGLHKTKRLSNAAIEVLAVIAYKGPCSKQTVDNIRGVDSSSALRTLVDNHLVDIKAGRPLKYITTKRFLEVFGLNSISDLPDIAQFQEIFGEDQNIEQEEDLFL
ncbi:MAG: SMC-Scp complex subunit ScpB [Deltaproteobacteria bacterium]|nr:SMC-Scp complex subunit ScpB [Deltaproteobacteria bacterium]